MRAKFVHVGVDALDDGGRLAHVNFLAVAAAAGAGLGELFLELFDLLTAGLPLVEEPLGSLRDGIGRNVKDIRGFGERVFGALGGSMAALPAAKVRRMTPS